MGADRQRRPRVHPRPVLGAAGDIPGGHALGHRPAARALLCHYLVLDHFRRRRGRRLEHLPLPYAVTGASARSAQQQAHAAGQHSTRSSGSGDRRSVDDCAPGCLPGLRADRRRSDRSFGFFLYGLSDEGGRDDVEESLPRRRSRSAARPVSTPICACAAASCASFASIASRSRALASRSAATSARNSCGAASSGTSGTSHHDQRSFTKIQPARRAT